MTNYNKTHLDIEAAFERNVLHRDYFAHYLRWSHAAKMLASQRKEGRILDLGCGPGQLADTLYRNRIAPKEYLGIDIRQGMIDKAQERFKNASWAKFKCADLCNDPFDYGKGWDFIIAFEVLEHIKKGILASEFISKVKQHMDPDTILMISTPCYDEKVGAANNHTIDGIPNEYRFGELNDLLIKHFSIEHVYGTFASQKDIIPKMRPEEKMIFDMLQRYYESNFLSVVFAPLHPELSRNCLWELKLK